MPAQIDVSQSGLDNANKNNAQFSGHGTSRGAAGFLDTGVLSKNYDNLGNRGDTLSITPSIEGFGKITIAASWDNQTTKSQSFFGRLFGLKKKMNVDLDLGCLYELYDGHRGAVQAFGNLMGHFDEMPYLTLSGDEKTGDAEGDDEWIKINGAQWPKIKRLLIYVYIYNGAANWAECRPQIQVRIPGQKPMVVNIASPHDDMDVCAVASLENVRNGIKLTNYTEYFHGQAEMDRAFGYGIEWADGVKK